MSRARGWSTFKEFLGWVCLYVVVTGIYYVVLEVLFLMNAVFPSGLMSNLLQWFTFGAPIVLMLIGLVSLLPISTAEVGYIRQARTNPAMARESLQEAQRPRNEKRGVGLLLAIAGITLLIGTTPWNVYVLPFNLLGTPVATFVAEISLLILVIMLYKKRLGKYVHY